MKPVILFLFAPGLVPLSVTDFPVIPPATLISPLPSMEISLAAQPEMPPATVRRPFVPFEESLMVSEA